MECFRDDRLLIVFPQRDTYRRCVQEKLSLLSVTGQTLAKGQYNSKNAGMAAFSILGQGLNWKMMENNKGT
jgi:hypothetical protein